MRSAVLCGAAAGAAVVLGLVAGCTAAAPVGRAPARTLLVAPTSPRDFPAVSVRGPIGVSGEGCVTFGNAVLVAPPGSYVRDQRVHLVGIGDFDLGATVDTDGFSAAPDPASTEYVPADAAKRCGGSNSLFIAVADPPLT